MLPEHAVALIAESWSHDGIGERRQARYREIRAKMTPMTMALSSSAKMDCTTMTQLDSQQLLGLTSPYPAARHSTAKGQVPCHTIASASYNLVATSV